MPLADLAARIAQEAAVLSLESQSAVLEFVLFIKHRTEGAPATDGAAAWERIIDDARPLPKLNPFLRNAAAEGEESLDFQRL